MEQAYTMLVRMMEDSTLSLFLCFFCVNVLALSLSHYPIYTYYAGNLNGSRKHISWQKVHPLSYGPLKRIWVHTYRLREGQYRKDLFANILRHYIGLLVYLVWTHFIYSTFEPKLRFDIGESAIPFIKWAVYIVAFVPFFLYAFIKLRLDKLSATEQKEKKARLLKRLGAFYGITFLSSIVLLITLLTVGNFSKFGLFLMLMTNFTMSFNFVLFRILRPQLSRVLSMFASLRRIIPEPWLKKTFQLQNSANFLLVFIASFIGSFIMIIYCSLGSILDWPLPNGIAIVMIFLYFYYFLIATIGKYYFVSYWFAKKEINEKKSTTVFNRTFHVLTWSIAALALMIIIGMNTETSLHELEIVPVDGNEGVTMASFEENFEDKGDTLFFICSHGGGLKANVWTLHLLNELQKETDYKLFDQTVAISGASGGSLGLALYGAIYGIHGNNQEPKVDTIISNIECDNYAGIDISMLMGLDGIRTFFPLNLFSTKDRSYFGMRKYQNYVSKKEDNHLNDMPFKSFWADLSQNRGHLPALIMNTASTNGKRGIFCTLNLNDFNDVFHFAENLSDLKDENGNDASVTFYQAVSTTNRFPIFSPPAKIKGAGHYIDAGAIDNSGILSAWDLYLYMRENTNILKKKKVVFLEIINSKSLYAGKVLADFVENHPKKWMDKDEYEQSALGANLVTGLNLNKIPGYLEAFLSDYSKSRDSLGHIQLFLPHKITIEDIEGVIDGKIKNVKFREALCKFLEQENEVICSQTESSKGFTEAWNYYEPVLSRQMSLSNLRYVRQMTSHTVQHFKDRMKTVFDRPTEK